jgi:hypothetical protein
MLHKEEIVSELVNLRIQIAQLKLHEKALYDKLDVIPPSEIYKNKETFKVLGPVVKKRKPFSYYSRQKMGAKTKAAWAALTTEQRAARAKKMRDARLLVIAKKKGLHV